MALMNCGECRREVSDTAKTCPHCGAKIKKPMSRLTMLIVGSLTFFLAYHLASPPPAKTPEQIAEAKAEAARYLLAQRVSQHIRESLRDPDSLKISILLVNEDATAACADYRARNGFGGMNKEFIIVSPEGISQDPADLGKHCVQSMHDMTHAAR